VSAPALVSPGHRFWPVGEAAQSDYETLRAHVPATGAAPDSLATNSLVAARFARRGRYRRGKLFRSRAGEVLAWRTPYGYRRHPRDVHGPARLVAFEPEAAIVRRIFDDYVHGGHSLREIIRRLAADQVSPPTGRDRLWRTSTLSTLLRNQANIGEAYIGRVYVNRTEAVPTPARCATAAAPPEPGPGRLARSCVCAAQGRDEAQATVRRVTGELADLAEHAAAEAEKLLVNARRALRRANRTTTSPTTGTAADRPDPATGRRRGQLRRAVDDLTGQLAATRRIAAQTRQRLSGTTPDGATRQVSLHDPDARPIAKGRLGRPVEFGYKAQLVDNDDGIVLDHTVERSNPADEPQLAPAIGRVIHHPHPSPSADRDRRPRLRRGPRRERPTRARRAHRGDPAQGPTRQSATSPRTPPRVPPHRQVAHRQRSPHQHPQTPVRLGPHPPRRPRRGPDLDRARRPGPQPGQDRQPRRMIEHRT
jgi:IS5 family transposase